MKYVYANPNQYNQYNYKYVDNKTWLSRIRGRVDIRIKNASKGKKQLNFRALECIWWRYTIIQNFIDNGILPSTNIKL